MNTIRPLRIALATNGAFSAISGSLMLLNPSFIGGWLGVQAPALLRVIGLGLVAFAIYLAHQAVQRRAATWRALLASLADFAWVVGTLVLLTIRPRAFSPEGNLLVIAIAAVVGGFGAWQLWAITRAHRSRGAGEYRHCLLVDTNAQAEDLWQIVNQLGEIKSYMPSLKNSYIKDGRKPSVGVVRICEDHHGRRWSEECTSFDATNRELSLRFVTEAPDFPFPARIMRGGWKIDPTPSGSQVMVWWEMKPKHKFVAPVLLPLLAFQVDRDLPKVIQRMAIQTTGQGSSQHFIRSPEVRLVPHVC